MKLISLLVGMLLAVPAVAQDYPSKPIKIITAFGPGTATDIAARAIGQDIAVQTGQTVVIDNKPGAEGQIAAQSAAAAAPDGYTLFFTTQTTQAINPHVYKSLAYDPVKSFAPISGITLGAQIVMVRNDLPGEDHPGIYRAGEGAARQAELRQRQRIEPRRRRTVPHHDQDRPAGVPYKTQPQAITDLMGGRIDIIFSDFTVGLPPVLDGRARGLAVTSKQRIPGLDQFPTVEESGVPGFEMWAWTAMYAPAGTPKPIIDKLNALVRQAAKSPAYLNLLKANYGDLVRRLARGTGGLPGEPRPRSGPRSCRSPA